MVRRLLLSQARKFAPHTWPARIDTWRERVRGVDFTRPVSLVDLGLDPSRSVKYSPSDDRHLRELLAGLPILPTDRILDYGCGKGRALRTMLEYPFAGADGVELSIALADTARRNFVRLGVSVGRCQIFASDASTFTMLDDYTHFYFYNPFPSVVVRTVVANIQASLERKPRDITVIYYNAQCVDDFMACGRFDLVREAFDDERNRSVILRHLTAARHAAA